MATLMENLSLHRFLLLFPAQKNTLPLSPVARRKSIWDAASPVGC
jgi:hypothetical protein